MQIFFPRIAFFCTLNFMSDLFLILSLYPSLFKRQGLFCHQQHFILGDYLAIRHMWLINFNDALNLWLLVVSDFFWFIEKDLHPQYRLPHTVHIFSVYTTLYIHILRLPPVYTAFVWVPCNQRFEPVTIAFKGSCSINHITALLPEFKQIWLLKHTRMVTAK